MEEELKGRSPHTYSQKFSEPEVDAVVNWNRRLIKLHAELVEIWNMRECKILN